MITVFLNFAYLFSGLTWFLAASFNLPSSNSALEGKRGALTQLLSLQLLFLVFFLPASFPNYSTSIHPTFPDLSCVIDLGDNLLLPLNSLQHAHNLLKVD